MKRFDKKENLGITLIALVITIVVLIILAGVVISLGLGENGIFNKAKYASEEYANEQAREELEIGKISNEIDSHVDGSRDTVTIPKDEYDALKNANSFSSTERIVGTWIDGTPLYQKTVDCGALPNKNLKSIPVNIENIKYIVSIEGTAYYGESESAIPLPFVHPNEIYPIQLDYYQGNIRINAPGYDYSDHNGYVTLKYTKTTDVVE